jgi:hypothetical protein
MYEAMLDKVQHEKFVMIEKMARLAGEIDRLLEARQDVRQAAQAHKNMRMLQLCLEDQEKRLKEGISSLQLPLQTGNLTATCDLGASHATERAI